MLGSKDVCRLVTGCKIVGRVVCLNLAAGMVSDVKPWSNRAAPESEDRSRRRERTRDKIEWKEDKAAGAAPRERGDERERADRDRGRDRERAKVSDASSVWTSLCPHVQRNCHIALPYSGQVVCTGL